MTRRPSISSISTAAYSHIYIDATTTHHSGDLDVSSVTLTSICKMVIYSSDIALSITMLRIADRGLGTPVTWLRCAQGIFNTTWVFFRCAPLQACWSFASCLSQVRKLTSGAYLSPAPLEWASLSWYSLTQVDPSLKKGVSKQQKDPGFARWVSWRWQGQMPISLTVDILHRDSLTLPADELIHL